MPEDLRQAPQPPVCNHCKKRLSNYWRITRFDNNWMNRGSVNVCSLVCLVNWSYNYGAARVAQGAQHAKQFFSRIGEAIRGSQP